jgi:hypothetical protein
MWDVEQSKFSSNMPTVNSVTCLGMSGGFGMIQKEITRGMYNRHMYLSASACLVRNGWIKSVDAWDLNFPSLKSSAALIYFKWRVWDQPLVVRQQLRGQWGQLHMLVLMSSLRENEFQSETDKES